MGTEIRGSHGRDQPCAANRSVEGERWFSGRGGSTSPPDQRFRSWNGIRKPCTPGALRWGEYVAATKLVCSPWERSSKGVPVISTNNLAPLRHLLSAPVLSVHSALLRRLSQQASWALDLVPASGSDWHLLHGLRIAALPGGGPAGSVVAVGQLTARR
jgi:hypothetical protein